MIETTTGSEQTRTHRPRLVHQPALDGLRGAAVAGVLLFHGGYLTGGYLGVDAFFVLSGFLITSLLLAELRDDGRVSLRAFWARRARRLLPALAVVLLGVAVYAWLFARPDELRAIRGDCWATLLYVANWRQIASSNDYFALFRSPSPLQHTWSLAIEEQFYLLWPLAVVLASRRRGFRVAARRVLVLAVTLGTASYVLAQVLYQATDASRVYYGTDTRAGAILAGAALAAWLALRSHATSVMPRSSPPRLLRASSVAAVGALACAWIMVNGSSTALYRGVLLGCGIAVTVVVAACDVDPSGPVPRALSLRPLRALGVISYGVYLWHWPLFLVLTSDRVHLSGVALLAVRCGATLVVARLSYRLVEQPIRSGAGTARQMQRLVPVAAVTLVVAVVAGTFAAPAAQSLSHPSTSGGVLVVGDSVGINLGFALDRAGLGVSIRSVFGCSLVAGGLDIGGGTHSKSCGPLDEWVRQQRPQFVLLTARGVAGGATSVTVGGRRLSVLSSQYGTVFEATLRSVLRTLSQTGATVIVLNAPCEQPDNVPPSAWPAEDRYFRFENQLVEHVVSEPVGRGRVVPLDFRHFVCPSDRFERPLGGVADARPDGAHFSPAGADVVAHWLLDQVPQLRLARRTRQTVADDLFDRLTAHGFVCTFGSAGTAHVHGVARATCAYRPGGHAANVVGNLVVDERPAGVAAAADRYYRAVCAYVHAVAPKIRHGVVTDVVQPHWMITGPVAPFAATALSVRLTRRAC